MTSAASPAEQERCIPRTDEGGPATAPASRRRTGRRPEPVASEAYAHLSVEALRDCRRALAEEEDRVSYWRRILQARLDLVASGSTATGVEHERLAPLLTSERVGAGRSVLVQVLPVDAVPPLPLLAELWDRQVDPADERARAVLEQDLRSAETQLSAYRAALHVRLAESTGELIARYRSQPSLCLSALPLQRAAGSRGRPGG